ncbi:MAG: urease accessory protein UreD [Chromatiaceae bacterium]
MNFLSEKFQPPAPTGWHARLRLDFAAGPNRTILAHREQRGPLAVQRPFYPEGSPCHVYVLHPPGGLVGGDRLEVDVRVGEGAHALLTTPGAAKLYRSLGPTAEQVQLLQVAAGGSLEWLPQENILFPGARARLRTELDLAPNAVFIGWEVHSLGRPAIGERFETGEADLGLRIRRSGVPLLMDRLRVEDGRGLDGAAGLRGYPVTGTLASCPAGPDDLGAVRSQAEIGSDSDLCWGVTLLGDLMLVRCLARGAEPVHRHFRAVWGILRPLLLGRPACPPRIWAT